MMWPDNRTELQKAKDEYGKLQDEFTRISDKIRFLRKERDKLWVRLDLAKNRLRRLERKEVEKE